jgi:aspartate aminotransferase-like enzyme
VSKSRLYAPGPVEVPPQVLAALAEPVLHHRTPEFRALFSATGRQLAEIFQVPGDDVLVLTASGTAGLEAGLLATVPRAAKIIGVSAGKFGERWISMARAYGFEVIEVPFEWGSTADPEILRRVLEQHPDAAAVLTTHSETSTGVLHDVQALAAVTRSVLPDALFLVDAVTSLAAAELRPADWQLDVVVSGSQKGLNTPPGLAFVWLSERAWASDRNLLPSFYLNLRAERAKQRNGETACTPATSLVRALNVALELLLAEGLPAVWQRRRLLTDALLAGGKALGYTQFARRVSPAVAALRTPAGLSAPAVVQALARQGVRIAGGQDHTRDFLIRPSLLGHADTLDAVTLIAALEQASAAAGLAVEPGSGVKSVLQVLRDGQDLPRP